MREENENLIRMMKDKLSQEFKEGDAKVLQDIMLSKQQEQNEILIKSQALMIESLEGKCANLENEIRLIQESFSDCNLLKES